MSNDDHIASKEEIALAKRQLDDEVVKAKREADDHQLKMEFLAPFWTDDKTTVGQALETIQSLLMEEIRSGVGKSAEQIADRFLTKYYPRSSSTKLRQHYIKLVREQRVV
jgi:hypothetical protein